MTNTALKAQIDSQITNETLPNSVSPADVGGNLKAVVDYVDQKIPFFLYASVLSQSGASAPTGNSKNNTGLTFTWSRTSTGIYVLTSSGSLSIFTCILNISNSSFASNSYTITQIGDTFRIRTYDTSSGTPVLADELLTGSTLKIEFYI
jgi:hypothetical protein